MTTKRIFLTAVALSLAGHIAVLAAVGFFRNGGAEGEDVFTVHFERRSAATAEVRGIEDTAANRPAEVHERTGEGPEETVDLDSTDTRFFPYLTRVKERIDRRWSYPEDAFARGEVGATVVEFSIAPGGTLAGCRTLVSSGHESLDAESLRAVRSAAPFEPFSEELELARLNIVATFRYELVE